MIPQKYIRAKGRDVNNTSKISLQIIFIFILFSFPNRKDKYKNLNELLNDKSHIAGSKDFYNKYSIVTSEYDDEYDDTYDDQDIGSSAQDDAVEIDRPFITPRVIHSKIKL